jgi:thioredoxin 1
MSKPVPVEDATFNQKVLKSDKPVLVDFWATWCRPCLMVAPVIDDLAEEYSGKVTFLKLDVDHNPQTTSKYNVMSIPTIMVFKKGQPVTQYVGFRPKTELKKGLEEALAESHSA